MNSLVQFECFFVVFYSEFGGSTLDSHHGFVVEYGISKDVELGRFLQLVEFGHCFVDAICYIFFRT